MVTVPGVRRGLLSGRLERGSTAVMHPAALTFEELVAPAAADPVTACRVGKTQALITNSENYSFLLRHALRSAAANENDVPTHRQSVSW